MKSKPTYKELLIQVREMRGASGINAYRRAKMLVEVFNDRNFRFDYGQVDDFKAIEILDDYVQDLAFGFAGVRALLEHYPNEIDWKEGKLKRMYDDMLKERERVGREQAAKVGRKKRRGSVSQVDYDSLKLLHENASSEKKRLQDRCDKLVAENRHLKAENERLRNENSELKRQLSQASVAA